MQTSRDAGCGRCHFYFRVKKECGRTANVTINEQTQVERRLRHTLMRKKRNFYDAITIL